jgi:UDP:flavonoid glycosyltransferase YjiC (YdhE family)
MRRALLAWEGGDNRGHLSKLRTVAEYLGDRFVFDAALCRLAHRAEIDPICELVMSGPALALSSSLRIALGNPRTATWGEFLGDLGFGNEDMLRQTIQWWQGLMRERDISLVIGDFAPCAMMAARGLGIPSAVIGTGYTVPPPSMQEFPQLLPEFGQRIYDEGKLVATVNAASKKYGIPPIRYLPEVYHASEHIAFTLPFLDPYFEHRKEPLLPPVGTDISRNVAGGGDEVFVYFPGNRSGEPDWVEALVDAGLPVRAFMPTISDEVAARLAAKGCLLERKPAHVDDIASRSRVIVHAASHGVLCMGLAAGLPQVPVPLQLEQIFNARRLQEKGVAHVVGETERSAESVRAAVLAAYGDAAMADRARALAREVRPLFDVNRRKHVRRRLDLH